MTPFMIAEDLVAWVVIGDNWRIPYWGFIIAFNVWNIYRIGYSTGHCKGYSEGLKEFETTIHKPIIKIMMRETTKIINRQRSIIKNSNDIIDGDLREGEWWKDGKGKPPWEDKE